MAMGQIHNTACPCTWCACVYTCQNRQTISYDCLHCMWLIYVYRMAWQQCMLQVIKAMTKFWSFSSEENLMWISRLRWGSCMWLTCHSNMHYITQPSTGLCITFPWVKVGQRYLSSCCCVAVGMPVVAKYLHFNSSFLRPAGLLWWLHVKSNMSSL